ncbi:hypothetical protein CJ030_MR1G002804 [Morella rubra]|uniref:Uncharacterized protein n=1 Tax=Morella rubra TaxID=262757 RepID=A0A6A1WME9_9ROSI|nr:hypothetical protein CJ030_MR1G002804 [Morella rubra]
MDDARKRELPNRVRWLAKGPNPKLDHSADMYNDEEEVQDYIFFITASYAFIISYATITATSSSQQTHQATVPSFEHDEPSNDDETLDDTRVRKARGGTCMTDVWNLKEGEWIPTQFNDNGQPLGDEGGIFNKFTGCVAHVPNQIPLDAVDWRRVPTAIKEDCWSIMTIEVKLGNKVDHSRRRSTLQDLRALHVMLRSWKKRNKFQLIEQSYIKLSIHVLTVSNESDVAEKILVTIYRYAQVMGPERHGRIRGVGLGPTPSSHLPTPTSNVNTKMLPIPISTKFHQQFRAHLMQAGKRFMQATPSSLPSSQQPTPPSQQPTPSSQQPMLPSHQASVPSFEDDEPSNDYETLDDTQVRKLRGETCRTNVWNLKQGDWIPTRFNDNGQPLGDERGIFNKFTGCIAHVPNQIPLDAMDWCRVLTTIKEDCGRRFTIPEPPLGDTVKHWFIKDLGEKWRNYKCSLKHKFFNEAFTPQHVKSKAPIDVNLEQFCNLVNFWYSDAGRHRSEAGKQSRSLQTSVHTAGSKSFARHAYELQLQNQNVANPNPDQVPPTLPISSHAIGKTFHDNVDGEDNGVGGSADGAKSVGVDGVGAGAEPVKN